MKRYDSYKDSGVEWIGEIPKGWKIPRLKHSITETFGGEVIDKSYWGEGPETLYTTSKKIHQSDYPNFNDNRRTSKKDLLLSRNGDGIVHIPDDGGIYTNVVQLVRIKQEVDRRFLWYSLTFQIKPLNSYSDGDFIVSLNKGQWFNLLTPLPPLNEQQEIVSFLDTKTSLIDSLIEKTQRKIKLLKEKRTSLINEVVTKGLNPNVEMKESGVEWIGEIPCGWNFIKIGYISKLLTGNPWKSDLFNFDEGVRILRGENVSEGFLRWGKRTRYWKEKVDTDSKFFVCSGDIIIPMDGSKVGKNFVRIKEEDLPILLHQRMCRVRLNKEYSPKYIEYFIGSDMFQYFITISKTEPMIPHITQKNIYDFYVSIPESTEQQEIVEYLDEQTKLIDKTISIEEKRIKLLKEYRQSLISEVVTGKRKVVE
ncbi:restriction endonuclease subunit S [Schleiferiaceae bacterium]|nr:restriction endonuclease subunit S [Schleiferiaceae bacterium]